VAAAKALLVEPDALNGQLGRGDVHLWLAEHDGDASIEQLLIYALDVVAVHDAKAGEAARPKMVRSSASSCCASTSKPGFFST
jgi:hypothetical protein